VGRLFLSVSCIGSTTATLEHAGILTDSYVYDSWGTLLSKTGTVRKRLPICRLRGTIMISTLIQERTCYGGVYHPVIGVFISSDRPASRWRLLHGLRLRVREYNRLRLSTPSGLKCCVLIGTLRTKPWDTPPKMRRRRTLFLILANRKAMR